MTEIWFQLSTESAGSRKDLTIGLFKEIDNALSVAKSIISVQPLVPNGSFEWVTNGVPDLWDITTANSGDASCASGCHGAYSLRLTRNSTAGDQAAAYTQDVVAYSYNHGPYIHYYCWVSAAGVKGGPHFVALDRDGATLSTFTNVFCNSSNYTTVPTKYTYRATGAASTEVRFVKVGVKLDTASTVMGSIYIDGVRLQPY